MRVVPGGFDRYNSVAATAKIEIQTEGRGRSGACECRLLPPLMLWNYIPFWGRTVWEFFFGQVRCSVRGGKGVIYFFVERK